MVWHTRSWEWLSPFCWAKAEPMPMEKNQKREQGLNDVFHGFGLSREFTKSSTNQTLSSAKFPYTQNSLDLRETMELEIIHQDSYLAVVVKPAGVPCHGRQRMAMNKVLRDPQSLEQLGWPSQATPRLAHRLDHGTKGPLMVAATADVAVACQTLWPSFTKTYHGWLCGHLMTERGRCAMAIEDKLASSRFQVLGHRVWPIHEVATLVEWRIDTGRTHQIRRHAAAMGHPIVGDATYDPSLSMQATAPLARHRTWTHPSREHITAPFAAPPKMKLAHHPSSNRLEERTPQPVHGEPSHSRWVYLSDFMRMFRAVSPFAFSASVWPPV